MGKMRRGMGEEGIEGGRRRGEGTNRRGGRE